MVEAMIIGFLSGAAAGIVVEAIGGALRRARRARDERDAVAAARRRVRRQIIRRLYRAARVKRRAGRYAAVSKPMGHDADLAEQFCACEPCPLCAEGDAHDVGEGCMEYPCLRCEARERLTGEPPVAFGGCS